MSSRASGSSRRKPLVTRQVTAVPDDDELMEDDLSDSDKPKQMDQSVADSQSEEEFELPEGTVVIQPEEVTEKTPFRGPEFPSSNKRNRCSLNVGSFNVHCTACNKQVNPYNYGAARRHPDLKVLICKKCYKFFKSGNIVQDEDGLDEQCRWCGDGGRLFGCDFCHNAFCGSCIRNNLGRSEMSKVDNPEGKWKCYVCSPRNLTSLVEECNTVLDKMKSLHEKDKAKEKQESEKKSKPENQATPTAKAGKTKDKPQQKAPTPVTNVSAVNGVNKKSGGPHVSFSDSLTGNNVEDVMEKLLTITSSLNLMLHTLKSKLEEAKGEDEDTPTSLEEAGDGLKAAREWSAKKLREGLDVFVRAIKKTVPGIDFNVNVVKPPAVNLVNGNADSSELAKSNLSGQAKGAASATKTGSSQKGGNKHLVVKFPVPAKKDFKTPERTTVKKSDNVQVITLDDSSSEASSPTKLPSKSSVTTQPEKVTPASDKTGKKDTPQKTDDTDKTKTVEDESTGGKLTEGGDEDDGLIMMDFTPRRTTRGASATSTPVDKSQKAKPGDSTKTKEKSKGQDMDNADAQLELLQEMTEEVGDDDNSDGEEENDDAPDSESGKKGASDKDSDSSSSSDSDDSDSSDESSDDDDDFTSKKRGKKKQKAEKKKAAKLGKKTARCAICHDKPARMSYGASACSNCRGFFARAHSVKFAMLGRECIKNNDCKIKVKNRGKCFHCRMQKCLKKGMIAPGSKIISDEDSSDGGKKRKKKKPDKNSDEDSSDDGKKRKKKKADKNSDEDSSDDGKKRKKKKVDKNSDEDSSDDGKKRKKKDDKDESSSDEDTKDDRSKKKKTVDSEAETEEETSGKRTRSKAKDKKSAKDDTASKKTRSKTKDSKDKTSDNKDKEEPDSENFDSDLEDEIDKLAKKPKLRTRKSNRLTGVGTADEQSQDEDDSKSKTKSGSKDDKKDPKKDKAKEGKKKSKGKKTEESSSSDDEEEGMEEEEEVDEAEEEEKEKAEKKGKSVKKTKKKDSDDENDEGEDDENDLAKKAMMAELENDDDDEEEDADSEAPEGSSDSEVILKKKGKKKKAGSDDENDSNDSGGSDSEAVPKKKKKLRSKLLDAKVSDSDSDIGHKKKKGKKRKRESSEDDTEGSEDSEESESGSDSDSDASKTKKKGRKKGSKKAKGKKKRKRIKKPADSSDEGNDEDEEGENESPTKTQRKDIRKVLSKKKIAKETKVAERAEEDRRKRIEQKQREFNIIQITDESSPTKCPITTKLVLEADEEKKPVLRVDKELVKKLKPHQVEAVQFIWDCLYESLERSKKDPGAGCILAHCMGLGKTLSVIAFVHTMMRYPKLTKVKNCLIVCPLNTVLNWQHEFTMWLDDVEDDIDIPIEELSSVKTNWPRADLLNDWHQNGGIMIMGYEMYRNLTQSGRIKNKRQKKIFHSTLVDPGPDLVVCDEGHILKNDASAISKAMNLVSTKRRIVLTGTPLQNNLIEYHCMVNFVKPNLLGTRKEFLNRFVNPITNGQCSDSTPHDVKVMKKRAHILHDLLAGCVQRKNYSALTKFLPPKHEYVIAVRLSTVQMTLYEQYLTRSGLTGEISGRGGRLFTDYQYLMRIWTHPWVLKLDEIRQENKPQNYDDSEDSFIDDDNDSDSEDSMSGKSSSSSDNDDVVALDSDKDNDEPGGSRSRRGQEKNKEKDKSDQGDGGTEIVKKWTTRSRCLDEDGAGPSWQSDVLEEEKKTLSDEWWSEHVKEEDANNIDLGGKLVLLFEILKKCEEIGDKVLVFSQSLLSLDIIEDFLRYIDDKNQEELEAKRLKEEEEEDKKEKEEEKKENAKKTEDEDSSGLKEIEGELEKILPECLFGKSWTKGLDYFRMDGSTNVQNRTRWASDFNDIDNYRGRLFLISTKAGSLGINLVGANRVIVFDASWNPSHDIQSIFRVYRFGQDKPVYVYRLLAQGTMEEKIYERQVTKQSLSQRVIDEHQIDRHFSTNDLQELYAFRPERLDDPDIPERPTPALPKDHLLAGLLKDSGKWIVNYHEHDSLLENKIEENLTEEERKAAWEEYENEKKGIYQNRMPMMNMNMMNQGAMGMMNPMMYNQQGMRFGMPGMNPQANMPVPNFGPTNILQIVQQVRERFPNLPPDVFQQRVQAVLRQMLQHQILQQQEQQKRQVEQQEQREMLRLRQIRDQIARQQDQMSAQGEPYPISSSIRPASAASANSPLLQQQLTMLQGGSRRSPTIQPAPSKES